MAAASPVRHELYVYYRAAPSDTDALTAALGRMHGALRASHPGLSARVLRRPEPRDGRCTWMEVYAAPPDDDVDALAADIATAAEALAGWIDGPRHVEHFVACAS